MGESGHSIKTWSASIAVKYHEARFRPRGIRRVLHFLAPLLLSGLGPDSVSAGSRVHPVLRIVDPNAREPEPYLIAIGAPGLRFKEPEPVYEYVPPPVAVGPPVAGLSSTEASVAAANAAARLIPEVAAVKPVGASAPREAPAAPVAAKPVISTILPDDTRPQIRPEDFIPFFQLPGSAPSRASAVTPAPTVLPPSSATYQQTPR